MSMVSIFLQYTKQSLYSLHQANALLPSVNCNCTFALDQADLHTECKHYVSMLHIHSADIGSLIADILQVGRCQYALCTIIGEGAHCPG